MGDGDGCRYLGVDVNLVQMKAAQRSLRRIFTLILVDLVLPIFRYLAYSVLFLDWKSSTYV